jgi:hypothetical protein
MITTTVFYREPQTNYNQIIYQDTGASTKRTLDRSLNSGLFQLSKSKISDPYPRFHGIRFSFDDGNEIVNEDFIIWGDIVELEAKGSNKRWTHTISIIEPTKLHERIFVSSKTFSRNRDGSAIYTMFDVLVQLREVARFEREDVLVNQEELFHIPTEVQSILQRIDAPKLFFVKPTLRESINGLLSYIDATYEIDINNNIILRFFNKRKNEIIDIGTFDDEMKITIGDYYSTELDVIAENMVDDKVPLLGIEPDDVSRHNINLFANYENSQNPIVQVRNLLGTIGDSADSPDRTVLPVSANYGDAYECISDGFAEPTTGLTLNSGDVVVYSLNFWGISQSEYGISSSIGSYFRSEDVILGDTNMILKLSQNLKLYEIDKVYISVTTEGLIPNYQETAECTEFFVTDAKYAELPNSDNVVTPNEPVSRQNAVIANLYEDTVTNFGKEWGVFGLNRTIDNMVTAIASRDSSDPRGNLGGTFGDIGGLGNYDNDQVLFTFIYRPLVPKMRITAARTDVSEINVRTSVRENQDENIVSIQNYGNNLISKANRTATEDLIVTETILSLDKLKKRGDFISGTDYILTEVEKVIWPEFLKVKYTFNKLFNKLNEFIGLESRRRQFELLPNVTADRLLNYTEYLQVFPNDETYENGTIFSDFAIERIIESLLFNRGDNRVRGVVLESDEFNIDPSELYNYTEGDTAGIYLPVFPTGAANSLLFTFSMEDTISAGNRIQEDDGVVVKRAVSYKDENGLLTNMTVKFVNYLDFDWKNEDGTMDVESYRDSSKNSPAVILENINQGGRMIEYGSKEYRLNMDIAERLASFTQQLQLLGYKNHIGIGNQWAKLSQLILDLPGPNLYLYTSDEEYDMQEDKKIKIDAVQVGLIKDYANLINKQIVLNASGISAVNTKSSWAIGDNNKELLIWVNQKTYGSITKLSFKAFNKRPDVIDNPAVIPPIQLEEVTSFLNTDLDVDILLKPTLVFEQSFDLNTDLDVTVFTKDTVVYQQTFNLNSDLDTSIFIRAFTNMFVSETFTINTDLDVTLITKPNIVFAQTFNLNTDLDVVLNVRAIQNIELSESFNLNTDLEFSGVQKEFDWVSVESGPVVGDATCDSSGDVGNVKSTTQSNVCVFEASGQGYFSTVDETDPIPTCTEGATYTLCEWNSVEKKYECQDYEGVITDVTNYFECQLTSTNIT